jgi:hypothetical protein
MEALDSLPGALPANQQTIPRSVSAVARNWLPVEEVNAIIHHLGATGSDISHGDRAPLASEVAGLSARREARPFVGGYAPEEANEIGSVRWTQDRRAEAGTGSGAIDCRQNGLVEASRANGMDGGLGR